MNQWLSWVFAVLVPILAELEVEAKQGGDNVAGDGTATSAPAKSQAMKSFTLDAKGHFYFASRIYTPTSPPNATGHSGDECRLLIFVFCSRRPQAHQTVENI